MSKVNHFGDRYHAPGSTNQDQELIVQDAFVDPDKIAYDERHAANPNMGGDPYVLNPNSSAYRAYLNEGAAIRRQNEMIMRNNQRPDQIQFDDMRGVDGNMRSQFQLQDPGGRQGLGLIRDEATRTGPSAWAQLQQGQQMDQLAQQGQGRLQQGMNQMAMQGGLRGGAGERMATANLRQQLTGGQGIRAGIANQDHQRQWQAMSALPGAELQDAQFQRNTERFNIEAAIEQQRRQQEAAMKNYEEQMQAWAAEQTARGM